MAHLPTGNGRASSSFTSARRAIRPARYSHSTTGKALFALSDRHGFIIASDECYSEIHFDEANPPLGALQAAKLLGRGNERLVMFSSLSKRSNVPGMRSGFVAGDAAILKKFLLYRTYHGCAMAPPVQTASVAAWNDEAHVLDNRNQYREKFAACTPRIAEVLGTGMPDASFYLWARTPVADTEFARGLFAHYNVIVLPGSFLARESGASIRAPVSSASRWSPRWTNVWRRPERIRQYAQQL
jgi:N-succinyldiaminopimelate aminotransferase